MLLIIKEAFINENTYLCYKISEQFNDLLLDVFNNHKKSKSDNETETLIIDKIEESIDIYFSNKKHF
ncbi:MAG: hypothetical protein ACK5LY_01015 [Lachnospirales bacterium]